MKCAPKAGWMLVGFGVAISLLLAIFVLAFANSNLKVWGFSGSKRMPCHRRKHRNLSKGRFPVQARTVPIHGAKPNWGTKATMLQSHAQIFVTSLQHLSSHMLCISMFGWPRTIVSSMIDISTNTGQEIPTCWSWDNPSVLELLPVVLLQAETLAHAAAPKARSTAEQNQISMSCCPAPTQYADSFGYASHADHLQVFFLSSGSLETL